MIEEREPSGPFSKEARKRALILTFFWWKMGKKKTSSHLGHSALFRHNKKRPSSLRESAIREKKGYDWVLTTTLLPPTLQLYTTQRPVRVFFMLRLCQSVAAAGKHGIPSASPNPLESGHTRTVATSYRCC